MMGKSREPKELLWLSVCLLGCGVLGLLILLMIGTFFTTIQNQENLAALRPGGAGAILSVFMIALGAIGDLLSVLTGIIFELESGAAKANVFLLIAYCGLFVVVAYQFVGV